MQFLALNGGPYETFSNALSMSVDCEDQADVDRYRAVLTSDGGMPVRCGWLKDKFGLSRQIVPRCFSDLLCDPDTAKARRVMQAMLQMIKTDIAMLEVAASAN